MNVAMHDEQDDSPKLVTLPRISGSDETKISKLQRRLHGFDLNGVSGSDLFVSAVLLTHKDFFSSPFHY